MHFLPMFLLLLYMQAPSYDSADVPAIREHYMRRVIKKTDNGHRVYYVENSRWTCKDPQRALLVSVDESLHWCHKVQF